MSCTSTSHSAGTIERQKRPKQGKIHTLPLLSTPYINILKSEWPNYSNSFCNTPLNIATFCEMTSEKWQSSLPMFNNSKPWSSNPDLLYYPMLTSPEGFSRHGLLQYCWWLPKISKRWCPDMKITRSGPMTAYDLRDPSFLPKCNLLRSAHCPMTSWTHLDYHSRPSVIPNIGYPLFLWNFKHRWTTADTANLLRQIQHQQIDHTWYTHHAEIDFLNPTTPLSIHDSIYPFSRGHRATRVDDK